MIQQTASVFKALGEPTRLTIMKFLSIRELCICELGFILDMSQPSISQHVKVLKQAGLVTERKVKQKSYFGVKAAALQGPVIETFRTFMQTDPGEIPELADKNQRFSGLDNNEAVQACKNGSDKAMIELKQIS